MTTNQYPKLPGKVRVRLTVDVYNDDYFIESRGSPSRGSRQAILSTLYRRFVETIKQKGVENYHAIATGEMELVALSGPAKPTPVCPQAENVEGTGCE